MTLESFLTLLGLFFGLFGPLGPESPGDSFSTLLGFRARNCSVAGGTNQLKSSEGGKLSLSLCADLAFLLVLTTARFQSAMAHFTST